MLKSRTRDRPIERETQKSNFKLIEFSAKADLAYHMELWEDVQALLAHQRSDSELYRRRQQ